MQYANFTRKQANVLYMANKTGKVRLSKEAIKMIYNLADHRFCDDADGADLRDTCKLAIDAYFKGDAEELESLAVRINRLTAPVVYDEESGRYTRGEPTF